MKKQHITNIFQEEKEFTLSLLRIPLNFFSENKSSGSKIDEKGNSDKEKLNINTNSSSSDGPQINLGVNAKNTQFHIELESNSIDKASDTKKKADDSNKDSSSSESSDKNTDSSDSEKDVSDSNTPSENKSEDSSNKQKDKQKEESKSNTSQEQKSAQQQSAPPSPTPFQKQTTPAAAKNDSASNPNSGTAPKAEAPAENDKKPESNNSSPDSDSPNSKEDKPSSPDKDKKDEAERMKNKFGKKNLGADKAKKLKDNAKNKLADKLGKNPAASKAMGAAGKVAGAVNDANKIKDAIADGDTDKMHEAVGDLAVKAGSTASKAIPGVGTAVGTAIDVADKTIGKTEVGKKAKKAIGCCCCSSCGFGCVAVIATVLAPILLVVQVFSWITNLFSRDKSTYGAYDEEDYALLEEATTQYSMQSYTDLTKKLHDSQSNIFKKILGTDSKYPIQEATEKYINEYYWYSEESSKDYNSKYKKLIEKGNLFSVNEGDLTSFGMAFEILKSNYTVANLKKPTSAPKRSKIVDGEEIVYTTYNPEGMHQSLFEDVLTNIDGLIERFDGQVNEEWFKEIDSILDKECDVYIEELDETRSLSLRDLLIETSTQTYDYDTEYYTSLVEAVFTYSTKNAEIIAQYDKLVDKLSMLELMTYMLAYQKYYVRIANFVQECKYGNYANIDMFDPDVKGEGGGEEFWGQFLTFSNVEHYLALSSLTNHSLAYDIAVTSILTSTNPIKYTTIPLGSKKFLGITYFENWYATYSFTPRVTSDGNGNFIYTVSNPPAEVNVTHNQQQLFDKYNIGFGLYDDSKNLTSEEISYKNQSAFFVLFEKATGIKMSKFNTDGSVQTPIYELDKKGISTSRTFPISDSEDVTVSMSNGESYSPETVAKYGLSSQYHKGIDYAVPSGTTVVASSSGTAYVSRGNTGYGNYVKIVDDDGYTSIYAHGNGTFYISNGSRVSSGQPIMQSGNSGNSTGPHLHFEVRSPSGSNINPTSYIYGNA